MPAVNKYLIAESPETVADKFGKTFYVGAVRAEADERFQLGEFLQCAADTSLIKYPLVVEHTRNSKPDFKINLGSTSVGVEATKVTTHGYETALSLQRFRRLGTMHVTPFLQRADAKPKQTNVIRDGFLAPTFVWGKTLEEEDKLWLQQAESIVRRKTEIFSKPDFVRQEENWLLIWDRLSFSVDWERRVPELAALLNKFWSKNWFTKVILEQKYFQHFVVFSAQGELWLPSPSSS